MDLNGDWLSGILQNWVADLLKWVAVVVGGVMIARARVRGWRWVDPLLYGLMTTVCLYILLYGFRPQGVMFLDWLIPGVFIAGSIALLLIMGRRERTTRTFPREDIGQWPLPSPDVVLEAAESLKRPSEVPVKILAGVEGQAFADLLVRILRLFDWRLQDNPESASYVFPFPPGNSLQGIRVRYRRQSLPVVSLEFLHLCGVLGKLFSCPVKEEYFPDTDAYNFIQVEIGSRPSLPR